MKKNWLSVLALILALAALALALLCFRQAYRLDNLEAQMDDVLAELARREALEEMLFASNAEAAPADPAEEWLDPNCTLAVLGWQADDHLLTLDLFVQAQLPRDTLPNSAELHMVCGEETQIQEITLLPCADGSFETELSGITFSIPYLGENDAMSLELHVSYGDGYQVSNYSAGWFMEDGVLSMVSG
jgi:hypothetical protein